MYRFWLTSDKKLREPVEVVFNAVLEVVAIQLGSTTVAKLQNSAEMTDVIKITVPLGKLPPGYADASSWWLSGFDLLRTKTRDDGKIVLITLDEMKGGIQVAP